MANTVISTVAIEIITFVIFLIPFVVLFVSPAHPPPQKERRTKCQKTGTAAGAGNPHHSVIISRLSLTISQSTSHTRNRM